MFYITLSITLLEFSQLSTKEISRYTKRTRTTRSFQTTSQPHDPKQESTHNNTDNNKKNTTTTPRYKTGTFLFGQSGFCALYTEWFFCPLFGAMAEDVCKTVAFLAAYSDELVQLNKHTLEALLKTNRAKQVKEWNAAKTFWYRKHSTLLPQHREELEDWEFVLCNMSKLEPAAFLQRLRRCFNRVDSFITERAEAIKKLACKNLETALQRKHMLQFPMSTFTRIFLERYKNKLKRLCVCWVHSSWLSCLARSSRQPKKFEVTSEELDDWEFVLCLMSILEPVAFLPRPSECHPLFKFN